MHALLIVVAAFLGADQPTPTPPAPAETPVTAALQEMMRSLEGVVGDEKQLVDKMREIDLTHVASGVHALQLAEEHRQAGESEQAQKRAAEAQEEFTLVRKGWDYVLSKYNNNAKAQTYYGELLYDHFGEEDGALKAWHLAVSLDPKLALPLNDLGIHYNHVGEYAQAMQYYDKAMELEPNNPDFMFNLVQTYLVNFPFIQEYRKWSKPRVYKEAMKLSKKAASLDPADYELAQDYAMNFFAAQNFDSASDWKGAAQAWQKARKVARNDAERFNTWLNEARVWIRKEKKEQAKTCLEESLKIMPFSKVARKLLDELEGKPSTDAPAETPAAPQGAESDETKASAAPSAAVPESKAAERQPGAVQRNFNK